MLCKYVVINVVISVRECVAETPVSESVYEAERKQRPVPDVGAIHGTRNSWDYLE